MQSLSEYEAEERRYQSLVEAEDQGVEDDVPVLILFYPGPWPDIDSTPAPPSYTAEDTATSCNLYPSLLAPDSEMACGVQLDSIPEDDTPPGSQYHMPVMSSPLGTQPNIFEPPAEYEGPVQESDLDSDGTLAELSFTVNEPTQATGVSYRVRPAHWAPSPIVRARELVESSPRSQVTHRRPATSRQGSSHSIGVVTVARGRSRSRDSASSRRPSSEHHSSQSRVGSRRNSGSHTSALLRGMDISTSAPGSRQTSLGSYAGAMPPDVQVDTPQAQASGCTLCDDPFPGGATHVYPPTYAPPQSAMMEGSSEAVGLPAHRLPPPTGMSGTGAPAGGNRNGAFSNAYMHANYSNPNLYPNMVSAAGLNYGTPFGSPMAHTVPTFPLMSPRAQAGQMPAPTPTPSRSSTGNYTFHAALDAMQSPSLGPGPIAGTADVETFAEVQRNADAWKPSWDVFPLKVYCGYDLKVVAVQRDWDDADLLRALGAAYDTLRGRLRKYFSFMDVWYVTMVAAEKQYVFPQRVGPAKISAHRNMRMRYLLAHPAHMRGQREIIRALTARRGYGVEFVEQARLGRMALFTCGLFFVLLVIAVGYGACTGDWIGGFSIGSFFGQSFALPVGLLQVAASYLMREC
ncbi:hypothetical protein GSI_09787 [Ganoderma sinense ZZ0214-1]|uniref:Uncharacterized protein n=1 Tax=Ganoderma sinense ZZ0214-1 TaxID=1077348 RepID=A0A2G8S2Y8_9APHY|nr:hypothetical protein GSI_09787 [Ganoderma sinense ZZ0214-1]